MLFNSTIIVYITSTNGNFHFRKYSEGGKLSVFLVNSVALVDQHGKNILNHTAFSVGQYTGEMNVDFWPRNKWYEEYDKHQVLIMTSQIFLNIVSQNFIGELFCCGFLNHYYLILYYLNP